MYKKSTIIAENTMEYMRFEESALRRGFGFGTGWVPFRRLKIKVNIVKKERSYYKKIVFILSAFTVLLLVLSVCILFSAAKSHVQKTIESSGAQYFKQITYNYKQANDAIRKF